MLKKFIQYYKPYKKIFILDMIAALLFSVCDLIYPIITRNIMNEVVPNKDVRMLIVFAITLMAIFIAKAGLNYFMQYWGHVVGVRMQADMRRDVFTHLQKLPSTYFNNNKSGTIMSRILNDLMEISELAHHGPEDLLTSGMMLIGSFIILLKINVPLTLIIFSLIPIIIWFSLAQRKKMNNAFKDTRVKIGEVNATLENSIAGMRVTKSFCTENKELEKFNNINGVFKNVRENAYKVMGHYFSGMNFFMDMLGLVSLIAAGYFTFRGKITLGDFTAYLLYVNMFVQPIRRLINFMEQYQNGMTGFERFIEIMEQETEKEAINPIELDNVKGKIDIENISFTYEDENEVFKDLSLSIKAGKTIALVGPSGGGKTTLCNLIPRFFEFSQGDIKIDGISVKDISLKSLRKNIGIVAQDVFLFTGTIKENILIGNPDASDEEII